MNKIVKTKIQDLKPGDILSTEGGHVAVWTAGPADNLGGFVWVVVLTDGKRAEGVPTQTVDKVVPS